MGRECNQNRNIQELSENINSKDVSIKRNRSWKDKLKRVFTKYE